MGAARKPVKTKDHLRKGQSLMSAGRVSEALAAFEAALESDPGNATALSGLGNAAQRLGMIETAQEFFSRAVMLDGDAMEARAGLAAAYRAGGDFDKAVDVLKEGLERDPDAAPLWLSLGNTMREQGDLGKAETFYGEAVSLKPNYGAALGNLADLLFDRGDTETAMAYYDRAVQTAPKNAQLRVNRAVAALAEGQAAKGWREYEWRFRALEKPLRYHHGLRPWDGRELPGRRLLIAAEQGIGDQILFASLFDRASSQSKGELVIECEERLVPLFARSFPEASVHGQNLLEQDGTRHARYHWLKEMGNAHFAIPMGSLPKLFKAGPEWNAGDSAYLVPDTDEKVKWADWLATLGPGPFTGICWRSGRTDGVRGNQYADITKWAGFIRDLPGQIIAVQYDASEDEIRQLSNEAGRTVHVPPAIDQKIEIDRATALLAALDQVVSAPTAVAAQSGAVGTRTIKVLGTRGWTNMGRDIEPFQPACQIVAGDGTGDWSAVFSAAKSILS